jgi:hypothetical protein
MRRVRVTTVAVKNSITYYDYVSAALVLQQAKRIRLTVILPCPALPNFSSLCQTAQATGKVRERKMYVDSLYNVCPQHFSF